MAIRIGTSEHDGTFHSQGRALKAVLDRQPSLAPVEVLTADTASVENANRLHADEIEFGFMASNWIGRAKKGEAPFRNPIDIRMAAPMNAGPLFFIARDGLRRSARSPICAAAASCSGRRRAAWCSTRTRSSACWAWHSPSSRRSISILRRAREALARGEVDAQFQCPIPNKVMTALSEQRDVRVLPYAPGQLEKLLGAVSFYRRMVMRKGALRGLDADVAQAGGGQHPGDACARARGDRCATRSRRSSPNAAELGRLNPLFDGLGDLFQPLKDDGAKALEFGGVALHPGAARAYREAGLLAG